MKKIQGIKSVDIKIIINIENSIYENRENINTLL